MGVSLMSLLQHCSLCQLLQVKVVHRSFDVGTTALPGTAISEQQLRKAGALCSPRQTEMPHLPGYRQYTNSLQIYSLISSNPCCSPAALPCRKEGQP